MLWLWSRPVATAPIQPLAWEPPYAMGAALKRPKKTPKNTTTTKTYSAIKKNEIMPFAATWMQLQIIILSEVSQKEKDKRHVISFICGI